MAAEMWWLGLTDRAAPADGEAAEAEEGNRKGHDVGGDVADDHHLVRVGWDEFGRHGLRGSGNCSS